MKKIIFILLIGTSAMLHAQYRTPYFNMLTVENGLPEANISAWLEDRYGYLWIGASNGLVRYDGYRLKPYPILNEEGVPVNPAAVSKIFQDSKGELWVILGFHGLYRFNRIKDVFARVSLGEEGDKFLQYSPPGSLIEDKQNNVFWGQSFDQEASRQFVYSIDIGRKELNVYKNAAKGSQSIPASSVAQLSIDMSGKVWLLTDSLLSYFEPASRSFKPYFQLPVMPGIARFISVFADPVDPDMLWIHTASSPTSAQATPAENRGLVHLSVRSKSYKVSLPGSTGAGTIPMRCFHSFADSLKRVWVSNEKGIALYNRSSRTFTQYPLNYPNKETHAEYIAGDKEGNLWISGNVGGLFFLDIKKGIAHTYEPKGGPGDLPGNRNIREMFIDRSGTLWINVQDEGLAWRDRQKTLFSPVALYPFPKKTGTGEKPPQFTIVGSEGDSICFLADTASLLAWNTLTNKFSSIDLKDKKVYRTILKVIKDKTGSLWIASGSPNGFIKYDPASRNIQYFRNDPKDKQSFPGLFAIDIAADKEGTIWLATIDKGLVSYSPASKTFTQYPFANNNGARQVKDSLDDRTATTLLIDKAGIIWIGTNNGGVNSFDPRTRKFKSYLNTKEGLFAIVSMFEDSRKRFWVSTFFSGLFLLDRNTGAIERFAEKEGLIHNSVISVQEDAAGNIWAATAKGMSRLNPGTKAITNFKAAKPWLWEYMIRNHYDRNGFFNLPGRNGMLQFNPLQLGESMAPPPVIIESVAFRSPGASNDSIMYPGGRKEIRLRHDENRLTIQYVALHFDNSEQNQYAYQLTGYDKDWIQAGTQRTVTYSNLAPGSYTFKVKASNGDGVWNDTVTGTVFFISPPWWKTWWAYCIYVLLVILAGYLIYKYQKYYIVKRERERTRQKELAQAREIEKAYTELKATQAQLIQSEKMASLGELTAGIAHEIQNPLNFVNNFSEVNRELVDELQQELKAGKIDDAIAISNDLRENEEKIIYHGKRADAIVKSMLQHSRSGSGQKEPTDINALCDEYLRLAYHGLRAKDSLFNAGWKTEFDPNLGLVPVVAQDLGRVLLNLINNAFYACAERSKSADSSYQPTVTVFTKKNDNGIEISVADNGNGIPDVIKEKIFQPFFTTKPTGEGTGLGLSLSYDIVKAHGGELKVETKPATASTGLSGWRSGSDAEGNGSVFTICLPNQ